MKRLLQSYSGNAVSRLVGVSHTTIQNSVKDMNLKVFIVANMSAFNCLISFILSHIKELLNHFLLLHREQNGLNLAPGGDKIM